MKIVKSRKSLRGLLAALALASTIGGCSFPNNKNKKDSIHETHTHETVEEVETNRNVDDFESAYDGTEKDNVGLDKDTLKQIKPNKVRAFKEENDEEEKTYDNVIPENLENLSTKYYVAMFEGQRLIIPDLSEQYNNNIYRENSIYYALKNAGFTYSYEHCAALAKFFGIENYEGRAEQNILLLTYLRNLNLYLDLNNAVVNENGEAVVVPNNQATDKTTQDNVEVKNPENNNNEEKNESNKDNSNRDDNEDKDKKNEEDKKDDEKHIHEYGEPITEYTNVTNDTHTKIVYKMCKKKDSVIVLERQTVSHVVTWVEDPNDPNYEIGKCACGKQLRRLKQVHNHNYDEEAVEYIDTEGTTHTMIKYKKCSCGEKIEVERTKGQHDFVYELDPNDDTQEIGRCACGKTTTRKHEHDLGTEKTKFEQIAGDKKNHKKITYQHCSKCKKDIEKDSALEAHREVWMDDPSDPTNYKILVCPDCEMELERQCKHVNTTWKHKDDNLEGEYCDKCHKLLNTRPHSLLETIPRIDKNDYNEKGHKKYFDVFCNFGGCLKELVGLRTSKYEAHNIVDINVGEWQPNADGTTHSRDIDQGCSDCNWLAHDKKHETGTCKDDGTGKCKDCGRTMEHKHTLGAEQTRYEKIPGDLKEHDLVTFQVCTVCNEEVILSTTKEDHDGKWQDDATDPTNYKSLVCSKCHMELEKQCKHASTSWAFKDDYHEAEICDICGVELGTREHTNLRSTEEILKTGFTDSIHKVLIHFFCDGCGGKELTSRRKTVERSHNLTTVEVGDWKPSADNPGVTQIREVYKGCPDCGYVQPTPTIETGSCTTKDENGNCVDCGACMEHNYTAWKTIDGSANATDCYTQERTCTKCGHKETNTVKHGDYHREVPTEGLLDFITCGKCQEHLVSVAKEKDYDGVYGFFEKSYTPSGPVTPPPPEEEEEEETISNNEIAPVAQYQETEQYNQYEEIMQDETQMENPEQEQAKALTLGK